MWMMPLHLHVNQKSDNDMMKEVSCFKSHRFCIYQGNKLLAFNNYENDKFYAQLSRARKKFYNPRA